MYVIEVTLDLVGCKFSGNSATGDGGDICNYESTTNIDGCPAGFSGAAGAELDTYNFNSFSGTITLTITGERKSYSCVACVR